MPKPPLDHPVLRAARRWRDRCLLNEGSVFTEKSLWTAENVGSLVRHFVENLDYGEGGFFEKLESQLAKAPASAKQLAAEMFWVMYLFCSRRSMQPGTKRRQIRQVWGWSGEPLPDAPFELGEALQDGVGNPGTAFNTHRWREFRFFILAMGAWTELSKPRREARLADPWNLAEWLKEQDETRTRQLRHMLLYMLFPDHFEPFATASQKRDIVREFTKQFGEDPNRFDYKDRIAVDQQSACRPRAAPGRRCRRGFRFPRPALSQGLAAWFWRRRRRCRQPSGSGRGRTMVSGEVRGGSRVGVRSGCRRTILG